MERRNTAISSDGDVVRDARVEHEWSRELVAVLADCSYATVARFEGEPGFTPSDEVVGRICRVLGIAVEDVLGAEALA